MEVYMDLFEKTENRIEKKNEKRSIDVSPTKHHKRYGTKKPVEKFDKQDIISRWREDI